MDQILNAGKKYLDEQSHKGQGQQGGEQQQQQQQQGEHAEQGDFISSLVSQAQGHDSTASGNSQLFGVAAKFLKSKMDTGNLDAHKVDEEALMLQHEKVTDSTKGAHADEIGGAAALNAIKSFISGNNSSGQQEQSAQGGDMQSKLVAMAMAQAGRMFDEKQGAGLVQGGDKQTAMNSASEQIMKLMIKNKVTGMVGGGQSGGLDKLAKMFM